MTATMTRREMTTGAVIAGAAVGALSTHSGTLHAQDATPQPATPISATPDAGTPDADAFRYTGGPLTEADRAQLLTYAAATWASFVAMGSEIALPTDQIKLQADGSWLRVPQTSPTNIGSYLWSVVVAEALGFIDPTEATERARRTVATVATLEQYQGFYYNWYDSNDGSLLTNWPDSGDEIRPFLSSVDNAWLAAGLQIIVNRYPEVANSAESVLSRMDFAFFYTPYDAADPAAFPGQMRGGYWPDGEGEYTEFHFGTLNSETRIITYLGIALGTAPPEHYWHVFRTLPVEFEQEQVPEGPTVDHDGVAVFEGSYRYAGLRLVPSWGGSMFEALMPAMIVPEADWAPESWALNHPLYVEAQIRHGLDEAAYGYWGFSPSTVPEGGYQEYGVDQIGMNLDGYSSSTDRVFVTANDAIPAPAAYTNGVVTPHAVFLALGYAPVAAMRNLANLARDFEIVTDYGFFDSVNVRSGAVSNALLSLDQGMVMGAIGNLLADDVIRTSFGMGRVGEILQPLIGGERFSVGRGT